MGQVDEMLEMSNKEAANLLRIILNNAKLPRGSGKTITFLRYRLALSKAIDLLEKTPNERKKKKHDSFYGGYKLCPDCDGKDFHPVEEFDGDFYSPYKCPKCRKIWSKHDDE